MDVVQTTSKANGSHLLTLCQLKSQSTRKGNREKSILDTSSKRLLCSRT